jgi:preprotein translocase subunit YajC
MILLQAATGGTNPMIFTALLYVGIAVVFYFFMIRPQQQKRKELQKFVDGLKKGDAVVTLGGMHGRVASVEGALVTLEVDKGVKMTFDKSAVTRQASEKAPEAK